MRVRSHLTSLSRNNREDGHRMSVSSLVETQMQSKVKYKECHSPFFFSQPPSYLKLIPSILKHPPLSHWMISVRRRRAEFSQMDLDVYARPPPISPRICPSSVVCRRCLFF